MGRENYFLNGFMEKAAKVFLSGAEHHGAMMYPVKKWAGRGLIAAGLGGYGAYKVLKNPPPLQKTAVDFAPALAKSKQIWNAASSKAQQGFSAVAGKVQQGLHGAAGKLQSAAATATHPVAKSGLQFAGDVSHSLGNHPNVMTAAGAAAVGLGAHHMLNSNPQQQVHKWQQYPGYY